MLLEHGQADDRHNGACSSWFLFDGSNDILGYKRQDAPAEKTPKIVSNYHMSAVHR